VAVDNGPAALDGEKIVWTLTDQQGTVRDIVSQKADESFVTDRLSYGPFGAPLDENLDPIIEVRYAGRDFDRETDLSYNRARYYEPSSGRFLSPDPIGFSAGDINLYRYAGNSPTNATDPSGHILSWIGGAIGAGIGVGVYFVSSAITGSEITAGGVLGAASGGFVAGAIAGALTGDVSALAVVGIGALSGGAGAFTNSAIQQGTDSLIQTGSIDISLSQLGRDTMYGAIGGVGGAAAGQLLSRAVSTIAPKLGGVWGSGGGMPQLSYATSNGSIVTTSVSREAARAVSARATQGIFGGSAGFFTQIAMSSSRSGKDGYNDVGADASSARLPKPGTPERAVIEAARRRGIRAAKAQELANIRAGGEGSGVWTKAELRQIRQTGKFPSDVRWHHEPTVANRPDLAADPNVVRPVRGGATGHLDAHGGDFRQ